MDTVQAFQHERMDSAMKALGLSPRELHRRMILAGGEVSEMSVYNWIGRRHPPSTDQLPYLALALGKSVGYFFAQETQQSTKGR